MKRFWTDVSVIDGVAGHAVMLDGRPVRTPRRQLLAVPNPALADAIAGEWAAVEGEIRPGSLPLTGLANAAIDIVAPDVPAYAASLARFAQTDLTCYRADGPQPLVARQVAAWEPPLKAVEARHGLLFRRTAGVAPVLQPGETLARVERLLEESGPWQLAALQPVVAISGSLVLALALRDGIIDAAACFAAGQLDEDWQAEHWGVDGEAQSRRAMRAAEFHAAASFLALLAAE